MSLRYKIVKQDTLGNLMDTVNKNLDKGWVLIGGPFVIDENIFHYAQAMVREEDEILRG